MIDFSSIKKKAKDILMLMLGFIAYSFLGIFFIVLIVLASIFCVLSLIVSYIIDAVVSIYRKILGKIDREEEVFE